MSISYLITKLPRIGAIQVDSNITEDFSFTNEVPQHPVESGFYISDAIIHKPMTISIEAIVSNSPIYDNGLVDTSTRRPDNAYNAIERLARGSELISVVTSVKTYSNMAITDVSVPRSADNGRSLKFTIKLQQVILQSAKYIMDEFKPETKTTGTVSNPTPYEVYKIDELANLNNGIPIQDNTRNVLTMPSGLSE